MKISVLKSIGHNVADSLASGIGLMIGVYEMNVFREAGNSPDGHITIDLISGEITAGAPSASLQRAIKRYRAALPELCEKHGATIEDFNTLSIRFGTNKHCQQRSIVTVENMNGRRSVDTYYGVPLAKPKQRI